MKSGMNYERDEVALTEVVKHLADRPCCCFGFDGINRMEGLKYVG